MRHVIALRVPAGSDVPLAVMPVSGGAVGQRDSATFDYFETPALRALQQRLYDGLPTSRAVHLVAAPEGSGKSLFLQRFVAQAPADWSLLALQLRTALGEAQLVRHLNDRLFPEEVLDAPGLIRRILARAREAKPLVLAVDDAERLSPFALGFLMRLKEAVVCRGGRLGMLLLAQESIDRCLATPSIADLGSDLVEPVAFPRFSEAETADYVRHCLLSQGLEPPAGLDETDLRLIHRWSSGRPGAIHRLLTRRLAGGARHRSLLPAMLNQHRPILIGLAVLVLLFAGGYFIYGQVSAPPPPLMEMAPDPLPVPPRAEAPKTVSPPVSAKSASAPPAGKPALAPPASRPASPAAAVTEKPTVSKARKPASTAKPAGHPRASAAEDDGRSTPRVHDGAWFLQQDASAFTIQLTSWADERRAIRYIEDNGLQEDAAYVHTRSRGKDWYLVVYRSYPSLAAARKAIATLPEPLRKYGPWVRNVSSLQSLTVLEQSQ